MKAYKITTIITIILLIAIMSIASFGGIYKLKEYKVVNVVPEYSLGMEFTDSRIIDLTVDTTIESTTIYDKDGNEVGEEQEGIEYTEENGYTTVENKVNPDSVLTKENFNKAKDILKSRLAKLGVEQYTIKQNQENGNIQIRITENDDTDDIVSNLIQKGSFELIDDETGETLLDTNSIESTKVVYGQSATGETTVYLQIKFNKAGQAKLEDISKVYVETTAENTNENEESEDSTTTKNVAIVLNGEKYRTTYFGETITDGTLNVAIGSSSDSKELQEYSVSANEMAVVLNSGVLPITYENTDYVVSTDITTAQIKVFVYIMIAILFIMIVYLIVKLKTKGLLAGVLQLGYIALLLLALRYTNIKITMEGIAGILISIIINYMYIYKAFKNLNENFIKGTTLKFSLKLIPIYIIAIVFTFAASASISSLGMTLVWGILTMYLYNLTLTEISIKVIKE